MKYDVIRYHQADLTTYLVMGVGMSHREACDLMLEDMSRFSSNPVLFRSWGEDTHGVVMYGLDNGKRVWCYLLKHHDEHLPPLGFWRN